MSESVGDLYEDGEFEEILDDAEASAANDWEREFVASLRDRWEDYGSRTFLSERQQEILEGIADRSFSGRPLGRRTS